MVFPSVFFPLLLLSINSSGLNSATRLPGFPTDSYFQFAIAIPFIQGALFSADERGHERGERHRDGLPEPPLAHAAAARRAACWASSPASWRSG